MIRERLSPRFWITSTALAPARLKSYLHNRPFDITIEKCKSSRYQLVYGLPRGSILGLLRFIVFTTPPNTLITQSSAQYLFFADDTQHFLSFSAVDFSFNITHLEQAKVSERISSFFVNPSKIDFFFSMVFLRSSQRSINNQIILLPDIIFDKGLSIWYRTWTP